MKTVSISWVEPTTREDNTPLPVAEIAYTEVSLISGTTVTVLAQVKPNLAQTINKSLADGTYSVRHVVVDINGLRGKILDTGFVVKTVANPGGVTGVKVTVT